MLKKLSVILGVALLAISLSVPAIARSYKIGNAYTPSHPINAGLAVFAKEVAEKTNGRITFDVIHSGVLGGEVEMIPQLMSGTLDAGVLGGVNMFESVAPAACVEDLPFLFRDRDQVLRASEGEFGRRIASEVIEPLGLKVLGYMEFGFRQFTNNKRPIVKPEDMKGIKFRSGPIAIRLKMFSALGATAVPIAFPELFTALQQGTVDGQENPLAVIESSKFYEVQKYLSLSDHISHMAPIVFNRGLWDSFKPEDQAVILEAARNAIVHEREVMAAAMATMIDRMKAAGMEVNEVDKEAFKKAVQPVWDAYIAQFGRGLIDAALKAAE